MPEFQVQFRMELTDDAGTPIHAVELGKEFAVNIYVVDQRPVAQGVFAAYLDLVFDHSAVERLGNVTFGESYTNARDSGGGAPGVLDGVGAVASLFDVARELADAPEEALLFRAPFRAIDRGPVTFLTEPSDRFPDSYVLLFGIDQPVELAQIDFTAITLDITMPAAAPLLTTMIPTSGNVDSTLGSSSWILRPSASEMDVLSRTTTKRNPPSTLLAMLPAMASRRTLDFENREEQPRFSDPLSRESLLPRSALGSSPRTTADESDWIELPFRLFSKEHRLSLPAFSHRQELLPPLDKDLRDEFFSNNSGMHELTLQADVPGHGVRRAFLRMSWSDHAHIAFNSKEAVAARMIDIDELFADAVNFDLLESNPDELIAERLENEESEEPSSAYAERLWTRNELRAARGTSLALEVGVISSDHPVAEPWSISDAKADAEQADAGPPKPNDDREVMHDPT